MADHKEVRHERLYLREPGTESLRKNAAGRLRWLLSTGWREVERWHAESYITVKVERTGVVPKMTKLPKVQPPPPRPPRRNFGGPGGFGGRAGPGGPGGSGPGTAPGAAGRPAGGPPPGPGGPPRQ